MNLKYYFLLSTACIVLASCSNGDKNPATASSPVAAKAALMQPFRFHKAIEVSPGQTYDVVSWGRGSLAVGSFAILHSDSAGMKYTTTTGNLDGTITDVYNADMDTDGNPEILIQSKGKDTVNYAKVYAFEFNDNDANKLDFPKLTNSQRKGYRGEDNFYIREGKLVREFPIYESNDSAAKPTGARRQLEYSLRSNSFSVKQLSKDSIAHSSNKAVVATAPKQEKKVTSSTKRRKQSEPKRKKRRHRR
ncbi:PliI family lysozyme inhibitor of I-type lysozyme [Mucilaginibacter sp.]|uniref:PliI family lysozyme inhibitor of I-type lysozyme n=1 Tax=Mucilaginibacter sp. TaxID=1882438 RepID=UPI0035BBA579